MDPKNLEKQTPSEIDAQLEKAHMTAEGAENTIRRIERSETDMRWEARGLAQAKARLLEANAIIEAVETEFNRRGGWERSFVVTNGNGHAHRSMSCTTCYPRTQYGWATHLSGKTEAEIIEAIGETACTVCYPNAPVAKLTPAERKSQAREAVAARKAEKAEIKRQKELAKVPRAHALALKMDEFVEAFGEATMTAYRAMDEGKFSKGYDNAYFAYSDMVDRRISKRNRKA